MTEEELGKMVADEMASHFHYDLYRTACVAVNCGMDRNQFLEAIGRAFDRAEGWSKREDG